MFESGNIAPMHVLMYFTGSSQVYDELLHRAAARISSAYRPKTMRTHTSHLTLFLQFLQFINIDILQASHSSVLAFIELLQFNGLSAVSIEAYISSLRSQFKALNLPVSPLAHHSVYLALRSISLHVPSPCRVKGIFDIQSLNDIVSLCDNFHMGFVYKAVFLLSFFSFMRLSNLVPPSIPSFSPLVHLCRGDFIPQPPFATLVVKWSKTLQRQSQFATVQIPSLGSSPLCPINAIHSMISRIPLPSNAPLFAIPQGSGFIPLTQSKVRKFLALLLTSLNIDTSSHTFHCFRRSGASFAFNSNVSLQAIQHQGTWSSDAVWNYIIANPHHQGSVASTFATLLQQ